MNILKNHGMFFVLVCLCTFLSISVQATDGSHYFGDSDCYPGEVFLDAFYDTCPVDLEVFVVRLRDVLVTKTPQQLRCVWRQIKDEYSDASYVDFKEVFKRIPGDVWLSAFTASLECPEVKLIQKVYAIECIALLIPFQSAFASHFFALLERVFNPQENNDMQLSVCQAFTTITTVSPELSPLCWNYIKLYLKTLSTMPPSSRFHEYMQHFGATGVKGDIRTAREHFSLIEFLLTHNLNQVAIPPASYEIEEGRTQLSGGDTTTYLEPVRILEECMNVLTAHPELLGEAELIIIAFLTNPGISDLLLWESVSSLERFVCNTMRELEKTGAPTHTPVTLLIYSLLKLCAERSHPVIVRSIREMLTLYQNDFGLELPFD